MIGMGKKRRWVRWVKEEDAFLIENYEKMCPVDIGRKLNRSTSSVISRASMLGIQKKRSDAEVAELHVRQVAKGGLLNIG